MTTATQFIPRQVAEQDAARRAAIREAREARIVVEDDHRLGLVQYGDDDRWTDSLQAFYGNSENAPGDVAADLASRDAARHRADIEGQIAIEDSVITDCRQQIEQLRPKLAEAQAALARIKGEINLAIASLEDRRRYRVALRAVEDLQDEEASLRHDVTEAATEARRLRKVADEIPVMIDPDSDLQFPHNFALTTSHQRLPMRTHSKDEQLRIREQKINELKARQSELLDLVDTTNTNIDGLKASLSDADEAGDVPLSRKLAHDIDRLEQELAKLVDQRNGIHLRIIKLQQRASDIEATL